MFAFEQDRPVAPTPIWMFTDARLADLGALLIFRHWLRCQLQEMAGLRDEELYPFRPEQQQGPDQRLSRLFF
jgi:hypothetical protein